MKKKQTRKRATRVARVTKRKPADLGLRRTPLQARALATFERILEVTAELLDEFGTEGVTTNHIAKAAGINVATLYQYFPNKQAVLVALFERQAAQRTGIGESILTELGGGRDWRSTVDAAIDAFVLLRRSARGVIPLRRAMRSNPQLLEYDRQDTIRGSRALADRLVKVGGVARDEAELVARCTAETVAAMLDMWLLESAGQDDRITQQTKLIVERYLAPYLDPQAPRQTRARKRR
jgi:AcrR family transcriptional regulator